MGRRGGLVRVSVAMLLVLSSAVLAPPRSVEASSHCTTSGPSSGAYAVTVCLTAPAAGATLIGNSTVTATATVAGTNPGVRRLVFYLNGSYVLTDFASPWTFTLRTQEWVDGSYTLEAGALMQDEFLTQRASIPVVTQNGVTTPPVNTNTFTPRTGSTPAPGAKFRVAAVGDGAGGRTVASEVVNGIAATNPNLLLYLGDVYEKGTKAEFHNWYGPQGTLFGRFRDITNPAIGNHEYEDNVAPGYFDYWDNVPNYYSVDAGGWHFVSINSSSQFNQTAPGSAQYRWLESDLAANTSACTVVFLHHPVLSVGPQGGTVKLQNMWKLMADWGVDVVLTAHDHNYQRWVPLDRNLSADPTGVTQFVVGGGGHGIQSFVSTDSRLALGLDSTTTAYGSLLLDLDPTSAAFQFVTRTGNVLDSGTIQCSAASADTSPPTPPSPLSATAVNSTRIDLTWSASTDNYGVAGYTVYRDGAALATVGGTTLSYSDTPVNPSTSYTYTVDAFDAAGNRSVTSNAASVTTPAPPASVTVNPVADSYVDSSKATTNYGTATTLRADASPDLRSYLRFTATGVTGPVTRATLRLYSNSTHSTGYRIHSVTDNTWTETGLTFNNAPTYTTTATTTSGALTSGTWRDLDITPLITGNGTYNIAITTTSSTSLSLASRESANPPQLIIDFSSS
ncbi:MAG: DNRLRE domain-containing protein [Acidimicrobiia bacterium]|nr:DNRLRE domain-containing protein [Acidimicrobiia bacterium]